MTKLSADVAPFVPWALSEFTAVIDMVFVGSMEGAPGSQLSIFIQRELDFLRYIRLVLYDFSLLTLNLALPL